MDIQAYLSDKLGKMLFLEVKKEKIGKIFDQEVMENVYFPIRAERVTEKVKQGETFEKIPLALFVEGMFYVLGADKKFKYNEVYKKILNKHKENINYIKGIIFKEVKDKNYDEAYILLKGLIEIENNIENYNKLFMIAEHLRGYEKMYKEDELLVIEEAKQIGDYANPYYYEALIRNEDKDYMKALYCINTYISKGGDQTSEVLDIKHSLENARKYEKGTEYLYKNPKQALEYFLPLLDEFNEDTTLLYYIGTAYRMTGNYNKAIYYLNQALTIDTDLVQVVNELGINYASLGEFNTAIKYLRKAFEATRAIEICTNLIMCYYNSGDLKQAKLHLEIAEKIDAKDEIVIKMKKILNE